MSRFESMKGGWNDEPTKRDTSGDEPRTFEPVPPGIYTAAIVNVEERTPKRGGEAFSVALKLLDGNAAGRRVFDWINFNLPHSPKATEIGQRTFRELCRAAGFVDQPPRELGDLLDCEVAIRVTIRPGDNGYPDRNEVKQYMAPRSSPRNEAPPSKQEQDRWL